ncbi:MAG: hypothetical protein ACI85U_003078, partial [Candidatus Promineifilaceae bacterium]
MNRIALGLSALSFLVVLATWVAYFSTVPKMKVPVNPIGSKVFQAVGLALGACAIVLSFQDINLFSLVVFIPAFLAIMFSLLFFWLLTQRKTPIGDLKVKVGDPLLPFTATTSGGVTFHSAELIG